MLLVEAGLAASRPATTLMARPTCMAIPVAESGATALSTSCSGNRVYTDLPDSDLWTALPADAAAIVAALEKVVSANAALDAFHKGRRAPLTR
jgi:uncharacterized protein (DUF169 family)